MLGKLLRLVKEPDEAPDQERLVMLAAAALLLEVAWADHDISDEELDLVRRQLCRQFHLSTDEVSSIVTESKQHHEDSVGMHSYTQTINGVWDEPRKFDLIVALWQLALSDDELNRYEEHIIRRIAELLYVSHDRFIAAKLRAKRGVEN
jgi:uncharacterized tellurite resistance protein B-like protein